MKYLIASTLFFTTSLMAITVPVSDRNPTAEEILLKKPEKFLRDESMIYNFNSKLGIRDQRRYTGADKNRLAASGHINSNYEHVDNLLGFDVTLMRRFETIDKLWFGAQFFAHNAKFDAISSNHSPSTSSHPHSEASYQRPGSTDMSVRGLGLGLSYRFKLLMDFWKSEDVFETVDLFGNYLSLNDTFIKKTYSGIGMTANYGIHKRAGTNFYYGGKLSYNIGTVRREAFDDEKGRDLTLTLGWLSFAAELGVFF